MPDQILLFPNRATDWEGATVPGARVFFYLSGTTTPATVYADSALTIPHPTPLVADAEGTLPPIWSDVALRAVALAEDGSELSGYPLDPVPRGSVGGAAAANVAFSPTEQVPEDNVQDAIERVSANTSTALANFGFGNLGDLPLLSPNNIDGLSIPGGNYGLTSDTAGTIPDGLAPALSAIRLTRRSSSRAEMVFIHIATGRTFVRYQIDTWGAWREINGTAALEVWQAGTDTVAREVSPAHVKAAIDHRTQRALFCHTITAAGVGAQAFTGGAWGTRNLTTTIRNGITGAALASSELTLPAGTYRFRASSYQRGVDNLSCTVRLYNVTAAAALANGAVYLDWGLNGFQEQTLLADIVTEATFAVETVVRIEHRNTLSVTDYTPPFDAVIARLEVERIV